MVKYKIILMLFFSLQLPLMLASQERVENTPAGEAELSSGFQNIVLGLSMDEVKDRLRGNPFFDFRGDPDISMLYRPQESLIECKGFSYLERAFFQFYDDRLYSIAILLDDTKIDHYTMFTTLNNKYGLPRELDPAVSVWYSDLVRMSLEKKPLTLKYLDVQTFTDIIGAAEVEENWNAQSREKFLENF